MSYEPAYSPWGLIQTRKTLCPGFFDVSTASHGGIMVAREFVAENTANVLMIQSEYAIPTTGGRMRPD